MKTNGPAPGAGRAAVPYVAPFLAFIGVMALERLFPLPAAWLYPIRFFVVLAVMLLFSSHLISFRASRPLQSVVLGIVVFVIWVAPDVLFGYRGHWLFDNPITRTPALPDPALMSTGWFPVIRVMGSTFLVPVLEELFWRGWMMRWLISAEFLKVPLGAYVPSAFWIVALLFASEHGPYWEVGLIAGVLYNWWIIRTRCLADCVLAHAVTNGVLSAYVLMTGQWQYWL